ncbi:hypothetical protein CLL_A2021 [Clostridium botulinum B str. Eklund 17B (NRP)]|uniref:Uncharacterized protein n=1 Tax=Clostridium botulinum (strain Eklund 17B / Type B) TaxID=935198 RepID=B2TM97_CLOBB|nr:hypothetical protein CLL_A2021 [Clostridium botulinum B str. Eklund 17B (NRP)]MBY6999183.1 hypothetical protein [Clostridium botulinum]CDH90930.1 hypothetical protein CB17B1941 [Clostridium botulinum B str. Eklund 17B (NRP)]
MRIRISRVIEVLSLNFLNLYNIFVICNFMNPRGETFAYIDSVNNLNGE